MSYYDTLGVSKNAEPEVIKAAYRAMSQKFHPDLNDESGEANAKMQMINEAYQILSVVEKRAAYDQQLEFYSSQIVKSTSAVSTGVFSDQYQDEELDGIQKGSDASFDMLVKPEKEPYFRIFEYILILSFLLVTIVIMLPADIPNKEASNLIKKQQSQSYIARLEQQIVH